MRKPKDRQHHHMITENFQQVGQLLMFVAALLVNNWRIVLDFKIGQRLWTTFTYAGQSEERILSALLLDEVENRELKIVGNGKYIFVKFGLLLSLQCQWYKLKRPRFNLSASTTSLL